MSGLLPVVSAHLGGIDEIAVFVVPAALVIMFMRRQERRARERQAAKAAHDVERPASDH